MRRKKRFHKKKRRLDLNKISLDFFYSKLSIIVIWITVMIATGIVLSSTRFVTPLLVVELIGMVGSLIVLNLKEY